MIEMLKAALAGKWSGQSEWYVPAHWEWFYRIKAVICILLNREPTRNTPDVWANVAVTWTAGGVWDAPGEPTVHWGECIMVGHGFLSNWWCTYYQDSD